MNSRANNVRNNTVRDVGLDNDVDNDVEDKGLEDKGLDSGLDDDLNTLKINKSQIDFSDIRGKDVDMLADDEEKQAPMLQQKQRERVNKEFQQELRSKTREADRTLRQREKEQMKDDREMRKLEKESGLYDGEDAISLRAKIARYRNHERFGKYLTKQGFKLDNKMLNSLNGEQLNTLYERVRFAVCNKNQANIYKQGASIALTGIEKTGCFFGLKLNGFSTHLNKSEEFHDLLDEILFEHQLMFYTAPEYRMIMLLVQTGATCHYANTLFEGMNEAQRAETISRLKSGIQGANQSGLQGGLQENQAKKTNTEENYKDLL